MPSFFKVASTWDIGVAFIYFPVVFVAIPLLVGILVCGVASKRLPDMGRWIGVSVGVPTGIFAIFVAPSVTRLGKTYLEYLPLLSNLDAVWVVPFIHAISSALLALIPVSAMWLWSLRKRRRAAPEPEQLGT